MICVGDLDSIGATIKARREERGWTRAELAAAARLPLPLVSYVEAGHEDVSLNTIRVCLYALNLYVGWEVTSKRTRWRVDSHVSVTIPGVNTRTWTAAAYRPTGYIAEYRLFGTWREAYDYADTQAREGKP